MLLVSCILITFHNKRQYDQCPCGKTGRKLVSYPDPYVRNDDHRLQYDITYRGSGNKVVPVRRNVVAPIKLQRSVT